MLDEKVLAGRAACSRDDIVRNVGVHAYDASWREFRIGESVLLADLCVQEPWSACRTRYQTKNGFAWGQMTSTIVRKVRLEVRKHHLLCFRTMEPRHRVNQRRIKQDRAARWERRPGSRTMFSRSAPKAAQPIRQSIPGDAAQGNELVNIWAEVFLLEGHSRNCGEQNMEKNGRINLRPLTMSWERVRPFCARMDRSRSPISVLDCDFCLSAG